MKIHDKIVDKFTKNNISYRMENKPIEYFHKLMTLHGDHDAIKSLNACAGGTCRFLRSGKIYKCPTDALSFKLVERFNIKNFPDSTAIDIYAKNFSLMLDKLNGVIEKCSWCNEVQEQIAWKVENKPKLSDFIID